MVFSSLPLYLDPPNWTQQQEANQDRSGGGCSSGTAGGDCEHHPQGMMVPQSETVGISTCSIRPSSMAERARLAKIPLPEPSLKCPRCDSTNTKFCYFNNYSLSQPRHFCKTCRRYWTRGGSLRNVPVGGGCRRNKRSKAGASSSSKPSAMTPNSTAASSSSSSTPTSGGLLPSNLFPPLQLPFMPSFHPMVDYGSTNLGLNFSGIQPIDTFDYQAATISSVGLEQWRFQQIQQFPLLGGFDLQPSPQATSPMGQFPFGAEAVGADGFGPQVIPRVSCSGLITQFASVKMEDSNPQRLSLSRQYSGSNSNDHYWVGGGGGSTGNGGCAGWPVDLSGFNSSS